MPRDLLIANHLNSICLIAVGGAILGLVGLIRKRSQTLSAMTMIGYFLSVAGTVGAWACGLPEEAWLPPLVLLTINGLFAIPRLPGAAPIARWLCSVACRPAFQSALLMIGVPGLACFCLAQVPTYGDVGFGPDLEHDLSFRAHVNQKPVAQALTDKGTKISLYSATWETEMNIDRNEEEWYLSRRHLTLSAIRTSDPSVETNCHGWVFAGGHAWLLGDDVETILKENGYHPISNPRPGDVAIFREVDGRVGHSAVVRGTGPGHTILLESKWGGLGRFLHTPETHPYAGSKLQYYRSRRTGNLLKSIKDLA